MATILHLDVIPPSDSRWHCTGRVETVNNAGLKIYFRCLTINCMRTDERSSRTNTNTACKHCFVYKKKKKPSAGYLKVTSKPTNQSIFQWTTTSCTFTPYITLSLIYLALKGLTTCHPLTSITPNSCQPPSAGEKVLKQRDLIGRRLKKKHAD